MISAMLKETANTAVKQKQVIIALRDALRNLMNGIETGAITSDHDQTFENATSRASAALKKAEGL